MDVDLQKIGTKISGLRGKKARAKHMTPGGIISKSEVAIQAQAKAGVEIKKDLFIACSTRKTLTTTQGIALFFLESKKKMTQKHNQPSTTPTAKEVNHTSHSQQPSQSSSSNQPSYQNFNPHLDYQSNYHRYPSQYY
jgi:hypothetical protein